MLYRGPLGVVRRHEGMGVSYVSSSVRTTSKSEENLWSRWAAASNFRPGLRPQDLGFVRADSRPHAGRRETCLQPGCLSTRWAQVRTPSPGAGLALLSPRPALGPPLAPLAVSIHTWAPGAPLGRWPAALSASRPAIFCQGSRTARSTYLLFPSLGNSWVFAFLTQSFLSYKWSDRSVILNSRFMVYLQCLIWVLAALRVFCGCNNINKASISTPQISFLKILGALLSQS